jgi:hypothetical protein
MSRAVGTTPQAIGGWTVEANKQVTVIGLNVCNILTGTVSVTVDLFDGANATRITNSLSIPPGDTLVAVGAEQKVVMEPGDSIRVTASVAAAVDVILSTLEITP